MPIGVHVRRLPHHSIHRSKKIRPMRSSSLQEVHVNRLSHSSKDQSQSMPPMRRVLPRGIHIFKTPSASNDQLLMTFSIQNSYLQVADSNELSLHHFSESSKTDVSSIKLAYVRSKYNDFLLE